MLSWIASCCQGKPKKGPMGEAAGVTNCRPAMLPRRERQDSSRCPLYLISSSSAFYKFTGRAEEATVTDGLLQTAGTTAFSGGFGPQALSESKSLQEEK